jgi:4-hydroxybenzoate polyprenyltransferase
MRGAGCTWNDIADQDFDRQVERTKSRPLPSGQTTTKRALVWLAVQALIAFGILLTFNTFTIWLGIASLLPVAIYPFAKRFTWWPQVFLGIAFNWGALLAWAAHTGSLSLTPVLLWLAGIAWTLFYDTIYAHQDIEDDALVGIKSTARLFGDETPKWLRRFLWMTIGFLTVAVLSMNAYLTGLQTGLTLLGVVLMGWHLGGQLNRFKMADSAALLKGFQSNRDAGLIPVLFFAAALFL